MSTLTYPKTQSVLNDLQRCLTCNECLNIAESPCTLGGCEHIFCSSCVENFLGKTCPVCHIPAHVKDAQVNRQLFHLVKLCQQLQLILNDEDEDDVNKYNEGAEPVEQQIQKGETESTATCNMTDLLQNEKSCRTALQQQKFVNNVKGKSEDMQFANKSGLRSGQKLHKSKGQRSSIQDQTTMTQFYDYADLENFCGSGELELESNRNDALFENDKVMLTSGQSDSINRKSTRNHAKFTSGANQASSDKNNVSIGKSGKTLRTRQKGNTENDSSSASSAPKPKRIQREMNLRRHSIGACMQIDETINQKNKQENNIRAATGRKTKRSLSPNSMSLSSDVRPDTSKKISRQRGTTRRSLQSSLNQSLTGHDIFPGKSPSSSLPGSGKKGHSDPLEKKNAKGETSLHVACIKGDVSKCEELLKAGANPNTRDNAGWTPLHEACHHGHIKIAEMLLDHGALINVPGTDNDTALHDAICQNKVKSVRLLVSRGASLTVRNIHGWTPVDLARTEEMKSALNTPVNTPSEIPQPMDVDLLTFQPLCFLSTGLSRDHKIVLQKCAVKLQAKVVEDFCPEVTHVITSTNKDGMCPRTIKYMQAVLTGKWIVSMEWINMCQEYGERVCEEAFEVPGTSTSPDSLAAQKGRINRQKQLPGLFDGCQFYFHGNFDYPTPEKDEIINLVKLGGARILTREPKPGHTRTDELTTPYHAPEDKPTTCIFIVHDNNVTFPRICTSIMRSVPVSWVLDCITQFQLSCVLENL